MRLVKFTTSEATMKWEVWVNPDKVAWIKPNFDEDDIKGTQIWFSALTSFPSDTDYPDSPDYIEVDEDPDTVIGMLTGQSADR
jgi:hypothetical protein